jgi:hypothetical protein
MLFFLYFLLLISILQIFKVQFDEYGIILCYIILSDKWFMVYGV